MQRKLHGIIIALGGLVAAILVGSMIGIDRVLPVVALFGLGAILALILILKDKTWVLIPTFWYLSDRIGFLPLPLSIRESAVLLSFAVFLVFVALRAVRAQSRFGFLELCVLLNVGYLATVYLRNPVGVAAFGSTLVGGRPYFETVLAILAYIVLTRAPLGPGVARILPCLMAGPQVAVAILSAISHFIPRMGPILQRIYSGVEVPRDTSNLQDEGNKIEGSRFFGLIYGNRAASLALISYFPPLSLLNPFRLLRFVMFALVCVGFGLAGFRSEITAFAFCFVLAGYFRHGLTHALRTIGCLALVAAGLVAAQSAGIHLPATAQRALSFLPGNWDDAAKSTAEESSEWRYYMWRIALGSDEFIKNKILGDGFGFSAYELQIMQKAADNPPGEGAFIGGDRQEQFMIIGDFHNGPLSAIRYAGWVGLALYLILLFAAAFYAWRLIKAAVSTPFFPIALFIGLPIIYEPIKYLFVFGEYDAGFPETIFLCAMLRLTSAGLARWREAKSDLAHSIPALANSLS